MPLPPNPLGTTGQIDDTSRRQHRSRAEEPTGETRSLLKTIREQIISDVEADTASMGLELKAEHWQQKEAMATQGHSNCEHSSQKRLWANTRMAAILMSNTCVPWTRHEQRARL
jgi:hypothetical protein